MKRTTSSLHNPKLKGFAKTFSVSFLNQIVGSGSNFLLGLYLVRVLMPEDFGLYGIGFAIVLLFTGFGNALFLTQMVVHLPDKMPEHRNDYASSMLIMLMAFCLVVSILICCIGVSANYILVDVRQYVVFSFAVLAASIANLMKWYFIRHAFSFKKETNALTVNASWAIICLLLFVFAKYIQFDLTASVALFFCAIAGTFSSIIGFFINNLPLRKNCNRAIISDFKEAFQGGRWALGGVSVTWLQSQAYVYISAILFGTVGVAFANAAKIFISPFTFIIPAVNSIVLPRLAEQRSKDHKQMMTFSFHYSLAFFTFGLCYLIFLMLTLELIFPLVIGDKYTIYELKPLIVLWGIVMVFQLVRNGASNLLQALKSFKALMLNNLVSGVVAISFTYMLAIQFGVLGALSGVAIGEFLLSIMLWNKIKKLNKVN
ncbi:MAG TPA: hypothetical protein DEO86_13170 [Colwellia sp.]|nr:hypothetical protein [Colwellia sp.]